MQLGGHQTPHPFQSARTRLGPDPPPAPEDRGNSGCEPWTRKELAAFTRGLTTCLSTAFDLFDNVLLSPHLDDGTKTGHWRNMLMFDPFKKDK